MIIYQSTAEPFSRPVFNPTSVEPPTETQIWNTYLVYYVSNQTSKPRSKKVLVLEMGGDSGVVSMESREAQVVTDLSISRDIRVQTRLSLRSRIEVSLSLDLQVSSQWAIAPHKFEQSRVQLFCQEPTAFGDWDKSDLLAKKSKKILERKRSKKIE